MDQVFRVIFTGTAPLTPPLLIPGQQPTIAVAAGNMICVPVNFLPQGFITRLFVVQSDGGTAVGALVGLYDSVNPYTPGQQASGTDANVTPGLFEILPLQTLTAGNELEIVNQSAGYPFVNQDTGYTNDTRLIYLVIDPQGADADTTWDVAITCRKSV